MVQADGRELTCPTRSRRRGISFLVDKQAWASGCFYEMEYPNGAKRTMVRPPVIFEETELPPYNRGPYLGEQTEIILKKLGYTDEQVAAMIAAGEAQPISPH